MINTSTNTVDATITVGARPFGIGITRDCRRTYVANYNSFDVSVIDSGVLAVPDPTTFTLPTADQCSQIGMSANADARLLGWSTSPNFPDALAQSQVDKGWGAIDDSISGVRMIFIPLGSSHSFLAMTPFSPFGACSY